LGDHFFLGASFAAGTSTGGLEASTAPGEGLGVADAAGASDAGASPITLPLYSRIRDRVKKKLVKM
jgi:hypothetical protein